MNDDDDDDDDDDEGEGDSDCKWGQMTTMLTMNRCVSRLALTAGAFERAPGVVVGGAVNQLAVMSQVHSVLLQVVHGSSGA